MNWAYGKRGSSIRSNPLGQRLELIRTLSPPLVESHLLVRFAIRRCPVQGTRGVAGFATFIFKSDDAREKRFLRRLPCLGVSIGEDQLLIGYDLQVDPATR